MLPKLSFYLLLPILLFLTASEMVFAKPHWDPKKVPMDVDYAHHIQGIAAAETLNVIKNENGLKVLRIQIDCDQSHYQFAQAVIELSGTPALLTRSHHKPTLGSHVGV